MSDCRYRNLLERRLWELYEKPHAMRSPWPPRNSNGLVRVTPYGIFVGWDERDHMWSLQGYGQFPYRDAIWLGEKLFDNFVIIKEDDEREIIDIDEF